MSYDKTYRVQGIPATFTKEDCRILLCSTLQEESEDPEPIIHSLGGDPYSPEFQIATVTFKKIPKRFQDSKDEWTLPITRSRVYSDKTMIPSITVDSHFSGFTPLNSVRDISGPMIDCIAITGLSSHPFGSWKQRNGEHMWLRDGLPHDLKGARVLSYGYNTKLSQSQTCQNIDDIATAFGTSMRSLRIHNNNEVVPRPLVFISHSLGGVILKRAIVQMKRGDEIYNDIFRSIYAVLFFGVPNQGIRIQHWLSMVRGQPNENLVRSLGSDTTFLRSLHEEFRMVFNFRDSQVVAVYETEGTRLVKEEAPGKWTQTGDYDVLVPISLATDTPTTDQGYRIFPIRRNHSDMVKFSSRWDQNYKDIRTCLEEFSMAAADVIRARFPWSQDRNPNQAPTDIAGWTKLHHAAYEGNENKLRELLRVSTDLESKDGSGRTPLHIAAFHGKDTAVKILLENSADKNSKNSSGQTPLYSAVSRGYVSTVEILVDKSADMGARDNERKTPLYIAACYGHEAAARLLVDKGADKEARGNGGWTPLHAAAYYGHETVVRLLLESGAKMESRNQEGFTPLHAAVQNGHEAVVRLLLETGADKMARTSAGETPLYIAANYGRDAVSRLLLDKGSDKEARDRDEKTPLYAAAKAGHEKVTKLLLDKGAKKNVKALGGWTPLHVAVWFGRESTSRALVESGANLESRSQDGETPLFVAARHGYEGIARLLVEKGANKKALTDRGWTPLQVAESNRHRGVARFLRNSYT